MKIFEKIYSKLDATVKYIFQADDGLVYEMSYIHKPGDYKDIICVPSQTSCAMGCKFCHVTEVANKIVYRNLYVFELLYGIDYIYHNMELGVKHADKTLLISFMGIGEPLYNVDNVVSTIRSLDNRYQVKTKFAVATSLPEAKWSEFFRFASETQKLMLNVKMHLSLHFGDNIVRKEWMPNALAIDPAVAALEFYMNQIWKAEIHYALIAGVNDSVEDAKQLRYLLLGRDIPVKLLTFNPMPGEDYKPSDEQSIGAFEEVLWEVDIQTERYTPPGYDVGASCGQLMLGYYLEHNKKS